MFFAQFCFTFVQLGCSYHAVKNLGLWPAADSYQNYELIVLNTFWHGNAKATSVVGSRSTVSH
jgi:hypothetical protein